MYGYKICFLLWKEIINYKWYLKFSWWCRYQCWPCTVLPHIHSLASAYINNKALSLRRPILIQTAYVWKQARSTQKISGPKRVSKINVWFSSSSLKSLESSFFCHYSQCLIGTVLCLPTNGINIKFLVKLEKNATASL